MLRTGAVCSEARSKHKNQNHAEIVSREKTIKARKKATIEGSILHEPLIPAEPSSTMPAVLHILLGITMSLWVALISAVQSVDKETFASKQYVGQIVLKLAYHVAKKRNQFEQTKKAIKESEERKKNCYSVYKNTKDRYKNHGQLNNEQIQLLDLLKRDWSEALEIEKNFIAEDKNEKEEKKSVDVLNTMLKELTQFKNDYRGLGERAVEDTIDAYPINAKHNPFYNQCFNGGDCTRLMVNWELLFQNIRGAYAMENENVRHKISQTLNEMSPVFKSWSKIIPLLRASRLLSRSERESLINEIKNFEDAMKSSDISITIKIQSIHALVNKFCSQFSQIDGNLRGKQVLRNMQLDKQDKYVNESKLIKEKKCST